VKTKSQELKLWNSKAEINIYINIMEKEAGKEIYDNWAAYI